jgi:hypothetical protein
MFKHISQIFESNEPQNNLNHLLNGEIEMTLDDLKKAIDEAVPVKVLEPDMGVLRQGRRNPPQFPIEILGQALGAWTFEAADAAGAPVDYVVGSLLAVSSALIGNSRRVSPWEGWIEPSILWIGLVGDPSSGKSPAIDPALNLVRIIEAEMYPDFEKKYKAWLKKKEEATIAEENWKAEVKAATKNGDPVPDKPDNAAAPKEVVLPRITVNDSSTEKLGSLLAAHPKGLLFYRDELSGLFGGFDRYSGKGFDRSFWIETYGGRAYIIDRIKNPLPIVIPNLSVSILGGIQPDKLSNILLGDDDGLIARFLWIWPDKFEEPKRPSSKVDNSTMLSIMRKLSALLLDSSDHNNGNHSINDNTNENENLNLKPHIISLDEPAIEIFQEWRQDNHKAANNVSGLLFSFYGKTPGYVLRLALILELLWWAATDNKQEPTFISQRAIAAAAHLVEDYFKPMAEYVFGDASTPREEQLATILAKYIIRSKADKINAREIARVAKLPGLKDSNAVDAAVNRLIEAGWLFPDFKEFIGAGRPGKDYIVNPKIKERTE